MPKHKVICSTMELFFRERGATFIIIYRGISSDIIAPFPGYRRISSDIVRYRRISSDIVGSRRICCDILQHISTDILRSHTINIDINVQRHHAENNGQQRLETYMKLKNGNMAPVSKNRTPTPTKSNMTTTHLLVDRWFTYKYANIYLRGACFCWCSGARARA